MGCHHRAAGSGALRRLGGADRGRRGGRLAPGDATHAAALGAIRRAARTGAGTAVRARGGGMVPWRRTRPARRGARRLRCARWRRRRLPRGRAPLAVRLGHLSLLNFRNYARLELELPSGPVLFVGENAQGKTNLLEAVYLLSTTRSLRAGSDIELIRREVQNDALPAARVV